MRTSRALLVLAAFACLPLLPLINGCKDCDGGGGGAAPSATTSASAAPTTSLAGSATASASASASAGRPRLNMRAGGATGALFQAASTLADLKPEQKTSLDQITGELRDAEPWGAGGGADTDGGSGGAGGGGARAEMKEAQADLAAGVKAGKIDTAKMDAHQAAMEKAMVARQAKEADALNRLYALLEAPQRSAAVANVRSMEEKRAARMAAHEKPDAGAHASFTRMRLERLTKDLDLDAEQQKKATSFIPKDDGKPDTARADAKKHQDTVLAAFEKDGFDAKKLIDPTEAKKMRAPMDAEVKFLTLYVPILKPEQRDRLGTRIQKDGRGGPGRRGPGGGGMHGGPDDEEEQEP